MKAIKICCLLFTILWGSLGAQQNTTFSQYMLNELGLNPASTGESGPLEIIMGRRTQWAGFEGAPVLSMVGISKSIKKKGFYHSWHGVGAYLESDNVGIFATKSVSVMYAWHKRLAHDYVISAGVSVGVTSYSLDGSVTDAKDPALTLYPPRVIVFPVINPGIRLASKKMYFDLAARQVSINKTVNYDGKTAIGSQNYLMPTMYFTVGRNFSSPSYLWTYTPSIQLRSAVNYYPTFDLNCVVFYRKMIGIGLSYRNLDSFVGMIQFRYKNKITLGLSYDYSISRLSNANANSREIIFGFTPYGAPTQPMNGLRLAQCPGFDR
jgi:type IX secretion system PorP/SprF family membrane protein